jgi:predicted transcriptional regulator YdeE
MRNQLIVLALALSALPTMGAELTGCGDVYRSDPLPEAIGFTLSGPRMEEPGPLVLAGLEEVIGGETADLQIDVLWTRFEQRNQWIANPASDVRTGVCFNGVVQGGFQYFAGQVLDGAPGTLPDIFSTLDLPAAHYAVFTLVGAAGDVAAAHALVYGDKLREAGLTAADAPDLLVFPPGFSPAKRDQTIEFWVPVTP